MLGPGTVGRSKSKDVDNKEKVVEGQSKGQDEAGII